MFLRFLLILAPFLVQAEEKPSVTCQFMGQLGNQMFQIATVVAYAWDHDCEACFPNIYSAENGELNQRHIFHRLSTSPLSATLPVHFYDQSQVTDYYLYAPIPHEPNRHTYLQGFFQNEKYFVHHKERIRALFAPSSKILCQIEKKYGHHLQKPTVAVHVRTFIPDGRDPNEVGIGGASWNYYLRALGQFSEDHLFLIFSDSLAWTRMAFPQTNRNLIFIQGEPHYIDFYLMSLCQHQIISPESTFSWWAAWLNSNPHKKVIAPDHWHGYTGEDAFPSDWVRVQTK